MFRGIYFLNIKAIEDFKIIFLFELNMSHQTRMCFKLTDTILALTLCRLRLINVRIASPQSVYEASHKYVKYAAYRENIREMGMKLQLSQFSFTFFPFCFVLFRFVFSHSAPLMFSQIIRHCSLFDVDISRELSRPISNSKTRICGKKKKEREKCVFFQNVSFSSISKEPQVLIKIDMTEQLFLKVLSKFLRLKINLIGLL